ncbi:autoinducer binding domain-containing protein [Asticcacaulis sp. ZE23SCel15]|uniref:helix-turn-helix transcriptional regulator n=1 Tax=Asticcacaulis sp. ZE23SCel15 TaxID=3059027 RepID=UPI00265F7C1E|nr:autoinducer binding domain-containing protein [Asticcacaulis sp. ZE23SCel15]WKL57650.1 autoinducer binding domain-containing protein [Asticcacaulis sp. ZE23SCel15]
MAGKIAPTCADTCHRWRVVELPSYRSKRTANPKLQAEMEVIARGFGRAHAAHPTIAQLRKLVVFDHFAISGIAFFGLGVGNGVMLASDMPEGFLRKFVAEGLYPHDPLSFLVSAENHWGSWHDLPADVLSGPYIDRIRELESEFGISTRSVVGFFDGENRFGGAIFCRSTPFSKEEKFILEMATRVVHSELSQELLSSMNQHLGLSAGEVRCLQLLADGHEIAGIQQATSYSVETIYSYVKTTSKKLSARGRAHALSEAFRRTLIK